MNRLTRIGLLIASAILLAGCNRLDNHQPLSGHPFPFTTANVISQSFVAHEDNLNMVNICLRNPARTLIPLKFILTDEGGEVLHTLNFSGGNIDNDDCTRFQFAPISHSAGKKYLASIATNFVSGTDPETERLLRLELYIEGHDGGDYWEGTASVDGVATAYDLHFKTFYQQDLSSVIRSSWHGLVRRLPADPGFMLIYLLLIVGLGYELWRVR